VTLVTESDALHARVRAFAASDGRSEPFDTLALEIARFQARHSPGFARLVATRRDALERVDAIVAVPADAFRVTRVAVHPPELDRVRFESSGTTAETRSVHAMRTTDTYRELSVLSGRRALLGARPGPRVVVALAADPGEPAASSLGFMLRAFMQAFDGRELDAPRWLVSDTTLDVAGLERGAEIATRRNEPVLLLATSFALVALLDALAGRRLELPAGSVVMQTGGFKGRTHEVEPSVLARDVGIALGIDSSRVIGEYGMTELSSQLYEATSRDGSLRRGVYVPPAWLRVTPVDPVSLEPVADGATGLARFVDLGNVDSAVAVVTQDLVRRRDDGIELCGRHRGAPARGCSLAVEALIQS
jgi:hypothetical protein